MTRRAPAVLGLATAAFAVLLAGVLAAGSGRAAVSLGAVPLGALAAGGWLFMLRRGGVLPRRADQIACALLGLSAFAGAQLLLYGSATVSPSPKAAELMARLDTLRADIETHEEWAKTVPERKAAVGRLAAQEDRVGADAGGETKVMIGGAFRSQVRALSDGLRAEFKEHQGAYRAALAAYNDGAAELEGLGAKVVLRFHPPGEPLREFRRRRGEPDYGFVGFIGETARLRGLGGWGLALEALGFLAGGLIPGLLLGRLSPALLVRCAGCGQSLRVPDRGRRVTIRCPRCGRTQSAGP